MSRTDERSPHSLLYRLFRQDIGRKLTALLFALMMWVWLATLTQGKREIELDIFLVNTRAEAGAQRNVVPGLYLVVEPGLIVRDTDRQRVSVRVSGLKDVVDDLELSAVFTVSQEAIGDNDEGQVSLPLEASRDSFRSRNSTFEVSEFDVRPRVLKLSLARRAEAEFELGAHNVATTGVPREGYTFDENRILVRPNRVRISGPRAVVEDLRRHPDALKLEPVTVEGATFEVTEQVGIDTERVDRNLTLHTAGGVVQVTIPFQARPFEVEMLAVEVHYENSVALDAQRRQVVSATRTVDLLVSGPRSVLEGLSREQLAESVRLYYDWGGAGLDQARDRVKVFQNGPAAKLQITGLDGRHPEIEYRLEAVDPPPPIGTNGDTP
ncbi:MAG: hypothetical protein DHS20C15_14760 [Planctomycetota bacterium]|nr:MAG: hypothetical protein DHS20C15_14760 [Planctomycetota bacterium]